MAKRTKEIKSYETAMQELQGIVMALQEETVSIDDLSTNVKRAAELIQYCKTKLRSTSEEIEDLF